MESISRYNFPTKNRLSSFGDSRNFAAIFGTSEGCSSVVNSFCNIVYMTSDLCPISMYCSTISLWGMPNTTAMDKMD